MGNFCFHDFHPTALNQIQIMWFNSAYQVQSQIKLLKQVDVQHIVTIVTYVSGRVLGPGVVEHSKLPYPALQKSPGRPKQHENDV